LTIVCRRAPPRARLCSVPVGDEPHRSRPQGGRRTGPARRGVPPTAGGHRHAPRSGCEDDRRPVTSATSLANVCGYRRQAVLSWWRRRPTCAGRARAPATRFGDTATAVLDGQPPRGTRERRGHGLASRSEWAVRRQWRSTGWSVGRDPGRWPTRAGDRGRGHEERWLAHSACCFFCHPASETPLRTRQESLDRHRKQNQELTGSWKRRTVVTQAAWQVHGGAWVDSPSPLNGARQRTRRLVCTSRQPRHAVATPLAVTTRKVGLKTSDLLFPIYRIACFPQPSQTLWDLCLSENLGDVLVIPNIVRLCWMWRIEASPVAFPVGFILESILPKHSIKWCPVVHQMMHPLPGPDNDGSTPLFLASEEPPVCIRSTIAPSSPKNNNTSLSPFLLSKGACEAGKHEKNGAKKVHQMMPRASNDALGRIDTSGTRVRRAPPPPPSPSPRPRAGSHCRSAVWGDRCAHQVGVPYGKYSPG